MEKKERMSYEYHILEKWLQQIKSGEVPPDVLGFNPDKDKALEQIRQQIQHLKNSSLKK